MTGDDATDWADAGPGDDPDDTTVVAQGTFDILHPGHVHYLRDAAAAGDHLTVIVARAVNVTHKDPPVIPGEQRRRMVAALSPVDRAVLGHPEDIFVPVERIDPDVLMLGFDQHHDETAIAGELATRGIDCEVRRASERPAREGELTSTSAIVERILHERDDRAERGD